MVKRVLLSKKRKQWIQGRTTSLKGQPLRHNIQCEARYAKRLQKLSERMADDVKREVLKLLDCPDSKDYFGTDASIASQARILLNGLTGKYNQAFKDLAKPAAKQMIRGINQASKSGLFSSLQKMTGGMSIKTDLMTEDLSEVMKATMVENDDLIQSLSTDYMKKIRGDVIRSITTPEAGGFTQLRKRIAQTLDREKGQVMRRANNIALDQTRKAYNNLNLGRMKAVGVNQFEWVHSRGGQRPRDYHLKVLDGNIYNTDDPPIIDPDTGERGFPGQLIHCRCTLLPVISFDDGELI